MSHSRLTVKDDLSSFRTSKLVEHKESTVLDKKRYPPPKVEQYFNLFQLRFLVLVYCDKRWSQALTRHQSAGMRLSYESTTVFIFWHSYFTYLGTFTSEKPLIRELYVSAFYSKNLIEKPFQLAEIWFSHWASSESKILKLSVSHLLSQNQFDRFAWKFLLGIPKSLWVFPESFKITAFTKVEIQALYDPTSALFTIRLDLSKLSCPFYPRK